MVCDMIFHHKLVYQLNLNSFFKLQGFQHTLYRNNVHILTWKRISPQADLSCISHSYVALHQIIFYKHFNLAEQKFMWLVSLQIQYLHFHYPKMVLNFTRQDYQ